MADSQKKGARMSDAERQVRKNRTIARSNRNASKYEERHVANLEELESLGGKRMNYEVIRFVEQKVGNKVTTKRVVIVKTESPSRALARIKREAKK